MTLSTMYPLVVGGGGTKLTVAFKASDSVIYVANASGMPTAPNYVSIIDDTHVITLLYSSISSNTIGGLTVVEYSPNGDTHTYPVDSVVGRTLNKADMDAIVNNINQKLNNFDDVSKAGKFLAVNASGNIEPTTAPKPTVDESSGILVYN